MSQTERPKRRFPPPWTVEDKDAYFIVRDHNGRALSYVYAEDKRTGAKQLTRDEARRITVNIAKLPGLLRRQDPAAVVDGLAIGLPAGGQHADRFGKRHAQADHHRQQASWRELAVALARYAGPVTRCPTAASASKRWPPCRTPIDDGGRRDNGVAADSRMRPPPDHDRRHEQARPDRSARTTSLRTRPWLRHRPA
jgi:hypothetical protein